MIINQYGNCIIADELDEGISNNAILSNSIAVVSYEPYFIDYETIEHKTIRANKAYRAVIDLTIRNIYHKIVNPQINNYDYFEIEKALDFMEGSILYGHPLFVKPYEEAHLEEYFITEDDLENMRAFEVYISDAIDVANFVTHVIDSGQEISVKFETHDLIKFPGISTGFGAGVFGLNNPKFGE